MTDWEIWVTAARLMRQHGEQAPLHAEELAARFEDLGDEARQREWQAVSERVNSLCNSELRWLS
jgi:hypothetical protein